MSRKRKEALQDMAELVPNLERHLARVLSNPDGPSANHYRSEALAALSKIERLVTHVGKTTAAEWEARISLWRAALEGEAG